MKKRMIAVLAALCMLGTIFASAGEHVTTVTAEQNTTETIQHEDTAEAAVALGSCIDWSFTYRIANDTVNNIGR